MVGLLSLLGANVCGDESYIIPTTFSQTGTGKICCRYTDTVTLPVYKHVAIRKFKWGGLTIGGKFGLFWCDLALN